MAMTTRYVNINIMTSEYLGFTRPSLLIEYKSLVEEAQFFFEGYEQEEIQATQSIILKMREVREALSLFTLANVKDTLSLADVIELQTGKTLDELKYGVPDNPALQYETTDIVRSPYIAYTGRRLQKTMVNTIDKLKVAYESKDLYAAFVYLEHLNVIMETSKIFMNIEGADMNVPAAQNLTKAYGVSWNDIRKENEKQMPSPNKESAKELIQNTFIGFKSLFK